MPELLTDIQLDLRTGRVVIDDDTKDAVLISGPQVLAQSAAIRLRTQLGQVKRMDLDTFGWDYMSKIKSDVGLSDIVSIAKKMENVVLEDERILDAKVVPGDLDQDENIVFDVRVKVDNKQWLSFPFTINQG